jgi:hypothetical protein
LPEVACGLASVPKAEERSFDIRKDRQLEKWKGMEPSHLDHTESSNEAEKNYEQRNNTDSIKFEMQYQYRSLNKVPTVNALTSPAGCRFVGQAELPLFERIPQTIQVIVTPH